MVGCALVYGVGTSDTTLTAGTTALTNDTYYANLAIDAPATLDTAGYRVFVSNTLTLLGTIQSNGSPGEDANGTTTALGGDGAPAGTSGGGAAGGNAAVTGGNTTNSVGANGGAGGGGITGGTASEPVPANGGTEIFKNALAILQGRTLADVPLMGGAGGGGGAGALSGGGGGGGGGVVIVAAQHIDPSSTGTISAAGGAGGVGLALGGGGGGGGGGFIGLFTSAQTLPVGLTLNVTGGTGGTTGGVDGTDGMAQVYVLPSCAQ